LPAGRARLLKIRFTANSFANPRRVRFQYRLSNHDDGWRETTDERLAYYTNLRPGRYRFEVKAATPHGVWSEAPTAFQFSLAPHYWQTWPFYALCGVTFLGLAGGIVGRRLRVQRRILRLEHQRALEQERARLARDLHDELGTALTGLALEMDVARRGLNDASAMKGRLQGMADNSRAMAARMRGVVWAISPRCDDVPGLATFLEQHAAPFAQAAGLRCRLEFPENLPAVQIAAETRHQLALGVREALTNVVRHAAASDVVLSLRVEACALVLRVADNGVGLDPSSLNGGGHGLANLRSRLDSFGGSVKCEPTPGGGTTVTFHLPLRMAQKASNS
jgi:signal transduction histidine kinase